MRRRPAFCGIVYDATLAFIKRCNVLSAIIEISDFREQRAYIRFCFKLGKTATEGYEMFKTAFGEPKLNPVNGKVRDHLDRRRQGKREATSSQCWFVSSIRRELFTKNVFLLVKQLILHSTSKSWKRLRENVPRKRPDQWRNNTWLLHHDNAPAHTALLIRRFLTDNNMTVIPHPPYSPDLAPSDVFLFPKLKMKLKGRRFQTEEIQAESHAVLNTLWENDFQECFKNWQRRWDRCQASECNYFEGDAGP